MSQISVEEASRNLKKLLEQVATGEEVILVEQDRVVAPLVPRTTKDQWLNNVRVKNC